MKYIYLINRFHHGNKTDRIIRNLKKASRVFHRDFEFRISDTPEDALAAMESLRDEECVVTAIGGDGSINRVLNGIAGTKNVLAFIPFGTGNDFYRGCRDHLKSGIQDADIVRINDRYFINTCCFGIDADIANAEKFIHNRLIPKPLRFHASVLYHFLSFKKGRRLIVKCEGQRIKGYFTTVVAANFNYYGGGYRVSPDSKLDDGIMEVFLADKLSRPNMARLILSMKNAGHLTDPAIKIFRTGKVIISSPRPIHANIDGEPLLADRFELELIRKGIRLDYDQDFINYMSKLK